MARRKRTQTWSYTAGKKGVNRVRAFEERPGGDLYLEWYEPRVDAGGELLTDPATGEPLTKRARKSLAAEGIATYAGAVAKAEAMAAVFLKVRSARLQGVAVDVETRPMPEQEEDPGPLTLGRLLDLYFEEVVPTKDEDTQKGNEIAARQFLAFFGRDAVVERLGANGRPVTELGRVRFNAWMQARKDGTVPGFPHKCRPQTLVLNFRFLRAVFEWGTEERDDGAPLMIRNPWRRFKPPAEDNPIRSEMTQELHDQLSGAAPNWRMALVMEICRETRRRMNSVRNLALADIDLDERTITWRAKFDKARKTSTTKVSQRTVTAIRQALEHRLGEGVASSPWLFPAPSDPSRAVSGNSLTGWMRWTRERLGIRVPRLGYHGEKRAGIRDPRWQQLPEEWREALSGTTVQTEKRVYGFVALPAMEEAVAFLEGGAPRPDRPKPPRRLPEAA